MNSNTLLSSTEAAELLSISPSRLRRLRLAGRIAAAPHTGQGYAYERSEVERFKALPRPPGRKQRNGK